MKVVLVTPSYPGPGEPHAGIFIHRQVLELQRNGIQCRVLVFRSAPARFPRWLVSRTWLRHYALRLFWRGAMDGVQIDTIYYARAWKSGEDVVPSIGAALCEWFQQHPDWRTAVAYAQFLWPSGAAALAVRDQFGIPVAAVARGGEMEQWHASSEHCRPHVEHVLSAVDLPLANCDALRRKAEQMVAGSAARMDVVYNGCDTVWFRPADNREELRGSLGVAASEKVLLYCGSIETVKGIAELAEAWRGFSTAHPEWSLVVAGRCIEPPLVAALRRAAGAKVRITGELDAPALLRWLQAADLYVQPSRLEGLANATMEAMAVGLPVVATDTGGQSELVTDHVNGLLVPPGDPEPLRLALARLASNEALRRSLGIEARRTICARFDKNVHGRRLAELLTMLRNGHAVEAYRHAG